MTAIRAIAALTVKEAIRNRILYLLLSFSAFLLVTSWIIGRLTVGDEIKIVKDLGLSSIHFFGTLITVIIGIGLVFREMEKRTVYLVLSKPIHRYQFLLGKFFGLATLQLAVLLVLGTLFCVILALKHGFEARILLAFPGIYMEWLLLAAVALMFSSFSTPLLSVMLTLSVFLMGHLSSSLLLLQGRLNTVPSRVVLSSLYYALPDLQMFNIRAQVVHGLALAPNYFAGTFLYWFLYVSTVLLFSMYVFQRKDFV